MLIPPYIPMHYKRVQPKLAGKGQAEAGLSGPKEDREHVL